MSSLSHDVLADRARGCLLGLAVGDALGRPVETLEPAQIRAEFGRLTELLPDADGQVSGTDDTEYAVFVAILLDRHGRDLSPAHVADAWRAALVPRETLGAAGFSELAAVLNLARGWDPPHTGRHRHSWSDGLAMRAAPYGVYAAGQPDMAARLAMVDGTVSMDGEGIHGGCAVAAAVAVAMTGAAPARVAEAARAAVPADSWLARTLARATEVAAGGARGDALTEALHDAVVPRFYPFSDLAPEAVALAVGAYLAADGDVEESVVNAVNLGRDADTIGAIAGALAGAGRGRDAVPTRWADQIGPLTGACVDDVVGRHPTDAADLVAAAALRDGMWTA
ncbi:ADP-ribosylglycohydrolase family protein [Micromonospora sp. NPDC007230]|uniref:ADP-ribosylglycohydrolase family protein n=1 Tax=Micromonospora sp. NPDC007230 TaxID=3364237 RepID=UPI0036A49366